MSEIIFEVREDEVDGGYTARALGIGIHTEGETLEQLRENVREAVACYFDEDVPRPSVIRLHFVRDAEHHGLTIQQVVAQLKL